MGPEVQGSGRTALGDSVCALTQSEWMRTGPQETGCVEILTNAANGLG